MMPVRMKLVAPLSVLLFGGLAWAQDVQSKPFNLVILSTNKSIDGLALTACHAGAAIETICIFQGPGSHLYLNTTQGSQSPLPGYEPSGVLTYNLPLGGAPAFVSEPMNFYTDPSTNVATPQFMLGYSTQYVTFDNTSRLAIFSYLDDTRSPPTAGQVRALRNWYVCQTLYNSYRYRTLNWIVGSGDPTPQNPSCIKVEVRRRYA